MRHHGTEHNREGWLLALAGLPVALVALVATLTLISDAPLGGQPAGVGMNAAVAPTQENTLTTRIAQREQELAAREEAVAERERELQELTEERAAPGASVRRAAGGDQTALLYTTIVGLLLLALILFNFLLDARRARSRAGRQ
jgi:hypothetical protein